MDHSRSPSRLPSCASFSVLEEDGPLKRTISWSCATSADNLTFSLTLSASQVRRLSPHQSTATLAATGPRRPYRRRHRPRHRPHRHHPHHAFTTALTTTAIAATAQLTSSSSTASLSVPPLTAPLTLTPRSIRTCTWPTASRRSRSPRRVA